MIEKKIHYCWFGNKPIPKKFQKNINTWKKFFPDYEIIQWNENNFPIEEFVYAKEALLQKKYAFVSDVARMYALNKYGGIYFDTDVEVVSSFSEILKDDAKAILGEEDPNWGTYGTGFMAFVKGHEITNKFIKIYKTEHFVLKNNELNLYPNTHRLADILKELYGIKPTGNNLILNDIYIYSQDYFTAFDGVNDRNVQTSNTKCIHHFAASWGTKTGFIKRKLKKIYHFVYRK